MADSEPTLNQQSVIQRFMSAENILFLHGQRGMFSVVPQKQQARNEFQIGQFIAATTPDCFTQEWQLR